MNMESPNHTSFTSLPLPELRVNRSHIQVMGAEVVTGVRRHEKIIHLRLLSSDVAYRSDAFEVVAPENEMRKVLHLLAAAIESDTVHTESPHISILETPDGDAIVSLKKDGRQFLSEGGRLQGLIQGSSAILTTEAFHPTLVPPFVVYKDRTWYHRDSQKKPAGTFEKELLEMGWVKMRRYIRI